MKTGWKIERQDAEVRSDVSLRISMTTKHQKENLRQF